MKIRIETMKKNYCERNVLDIENIELESGNIYGILGPNGAGKTTFLKMLAGIEDDFEGNIYSEINCTKDYMPQRPYIFNLSVLENAMLGQKVENENEAVDMLKSVGLGDFINRKAKDLSGGEAQRLMIARTLLCDGDITVLDEPTSAIDLESLGFLHSVIREHKDRRKGIIIFSTHNPAEALKLADRVLIFYHGKIVENGKPDEVLQNPRSDEGKAFMCNWRM